MSHPNRIDVVSMSPVVPRQTPKDDFGARLSSALSSIVAVGDSVTQAALGAPLLSAATSAVMPMVSRSSALSTTGSPQSVSAATPRTSTTDTVTQDSVSDMRSQSAQYLELQMAMQQESREYNALTNILKVRHDSAKAAINNLK